MVEYAKKATLHKYDVENSNNTKIANFNQLKYSSSFLIQNLPSLSLLHFFKECNHF